MSKMDNLRAMREAKYAEALKRAASAPTRPSAPIAPSAPARSAARSAPAGQSDSSGPADPSAEGLCGHRNMSGRTCTRESGHPQKSHRYS